MELNGEIMIATTPILPLHLFLSCQINMGTSHYTGVPLKVTWPHIGQDLKLIQGTEMATIKGHLNQKQQGTRSTGMEDDQPLQEPGNIKTHHVFITRQNIF